MNRLTVGTRSPPQQTEASFYGEDRAELIALNKILVALDLIEIRKEMVTRVDDQGRRWKDATTSTGSRITAMTTSSVVVMC